MCAIFLVLMKVQLHLISKHFFFLSFLFRLSFVMTFTVLNVEDSFSLFLLSCNSHDVAININKTTSGEYLFETRYTEDNDTI